MIKKYKKIVTTFLAMIMLFSNFLIYNDYTCYATNTTSEVMENVNIESSADLVMDMTTGEILFANNIHDKLYPASITKLLTGLLACEYGDMNDTITFNSDSVNLEDGSSNLAFVEGEKIKLKDLLYGLMLKSANEAANQLAYYIEEKSGMTYKEAASKKLQEIGAFDSSFTSPSGLHKDTHYTTCYDMALIAKAAFNNETFREIFSTQSYTIPKTNKYEERELFNTHKMLYKSSPYYLDCVIGGKTGYTSEAGHTLVTFTDNGNLKLLCVSLDGETYFNDTYRLVKYFNKYFTTKTFYNKNDTFTSISVVDSNDVVIDQLDLKISEDLTLTLPNDWADDYIKSLIKEKRKVMFKNEADELTNENSSSENENQSENTENDNEESDNEESQNNFEDTLDYDNLEINDELLAEYGITNEQINKYIFDYSSDLFEIKVNIPENISTTVLENDVIGDITITFNDGTTKVISIVSKEAYDLSDSIDFTILYIILFIGFLVILIIYSKKMISLVEEEKEIKKQKDKDIKTKSNAKKNKK